jgi:hypothetical protein
MTELQGAAVVFAPLFAIFGVCFIVFHQHISDAARRAYEDTRSRGAGSAPRPSRQGW